MEIKKFYKEGVEYTLPKFPSSNEVEEFEDKIKSIELMKPTSLELVIGNKGAKSIVWDEISKSYIATYTVENNAGINSQTRNVYFTTGIEPDMGGVLIKNIGETTIKFQPLFSKAKGNWNLGINVRETMELTPGETVLIKRNTGDFEAFMLSIHNINLNNEENKLQFQFFTSHIKEEVDEETILNVIHAITADNARTAERAFFAYSNAFNESGKPANQQIYGNPGTGDFMTINNNKITIKFDKGENDNDTANNFLTFGIKLIRGQYIYLKATNHNTDTSTFTQSNYPFFTDLFRHGTFGYQINGGLDWGGYRLLGGFSELEKGIVLDTDTFAPEFDNGRFLQLNSQFSYIPNGHILKNMSADFDIEFAIFDKDEYAKTMFLAKHSETSDTAINAKYVENVGLIPVAINGSATIINGDEEKTIAPRRAMYDRSKIRLQCPQYSGKSGNAQRYNVCYYDANWLIRNGFKKLVLKGKNSNTISDAWYITDIKTSYSQVSWGPGSEAHTFNTGTKTRGSSFQFVIDLEQLMKGYPEGKQVWFLISSFTTESSKSGNTIDFELFGVDERVNNVFDVNSYYTKEEVDQMINSSDSNRYITFWGDSLTAGGGWTSRLANLAGMTERNGGTGGESSATILARQGGDVMLVNNITIPADTTEVRIAKRDIDGGILTYEGKKVTPLLQGGAHVNPVKIGDIEGTLRWTGSSYATPDAEWLFKRTVAGAEKVINRPTAMTTAFDRLYNAPYLQVIFIGQNGGYSDLDDLVRQHRLIIEHSKAKHTVVLGLSSGTKEGRAEYEARMKKEFGRYFICLREYLATPIYDENGEIISCYGMKDQNVEIDPSYSRQGKTTKEEITEGTCPHQILADSVHYTTGTKQVIGDYVFKRCKELGIF